MPGWPRLAWAAAFLVVAVAAAAPGLVWDDDEPCFETPHPPSASHGVTFDAASGRMILDWADGSSTTFDVDQPLCDPELVAFVRQEQAAAGAILFGSCQALQNLVDHLRGRHGPDPSIVPITPADYEAVGSGRPGLLEGVFDLAGAERLLREDC